MTRRTIYGTLTQNDELNENEKAMLYIKECAESVGLKVIEGKTAFSITFMAEIMRRLRKKQQPCGNAISREDLEECKELMTDVNGDTVYAVRMSDIRQLPPVTPQEPKIVDTLDFAIDASNGDTNYFVGFRNGLRYSKSLIDGEEPQFESCTEQEPKTGRWIEERTYMECPNCSDIWHYEANQTERFKFCPTCGKGLNNESKHIRNRVRNNRTN